MRHHDIQRTIQREMSAEKTSANICEVPMPNLSFDTPFWYELPIFTNNFINFPKQHFREYHLVQRRVQTPQDNTDRDTSNQKTHHLVTFHTRKYAQRPLIVKQLRELTLCYNTLVSDQEITTLFKHGVSFPSHTLIQ